MAQCTTPGSRKKEDGKGLVFYPCGKCPNCIARKTSNWSFRLIEEDKRAHSAYFITLTYNNDHVPITGNKFMSVRKKDLQDFFKRLRYYSPSKPAIKYYAVSEYGSKTKRPHYHVILFNATTENVEKAWRDKDGNPLGSIFFGTITSASVGYTLKYLSKKGQIPMHARDDRVPEFQLMSKKLGSNYLTDEMVQWHEADIMNRMYCNLPGGIKLAMPRYYKEKIYTKEQRQQIGEHYMQKQVQHLKEVIKNHDGDYHRDMLEAYKRDVQLQYIKASKKDVL